MLSSSQPVLPPINSPPPIDIPALSPVDDSTTSSPATARDVSGDGDRTPNPPRPSRPVHTNVLARLQALFPSAPHLYSSPSALPSDPPPPPLPPPKPTRKFIKVRILTWNMHDSLPKGDVEELLGTVPTPSSLPPSDSPSALPDFPSSPDHPYHIVIVAGQECPSASGIPMALGAGFKLNNKDNSRSRHSLLPQDADEPILRKSAEAELLSPSIEKPQEHHHPPSSWSSILEDWYCNTPSANPPATSTSDLNLRTPLESERLGPYELLIKERMMGLYLAVFIHREARPFVLGKSAVTTGLIGGRVGNKGGVAVSVNLDGTSFLFVNAHLAAHEGKVHHRLADLAKIKAELAVDDFLAADDPRIMAEDITDRFDTTFIFGDLNFRLNVTRLHADWLISRREYEQALEFDQLRKVMATGNSFAGFNEASINFPPTFKYDVLRTVKRSRTKSFKRPSATAIILTPHEKLLSEVTEHDQEEHEAEEDRRSLNDRTGEEDVEPDAASIASSAWTYARSRHTGDVDPEDDEPETERDANYVRYSVQSPPASASATHLMHKVWTTAAAHKAKRKWVALFNARHPKSPSHVNPSPDAEPSLADAGEARKKWRRSWASSKSAGVRSPSRRESEPASLPPETPIDPADPRQSKLGRTREFQAALLDAVHARPHKHLALSENNIDLEEDKGVYDSSHKQRVPSWCDRILWKSTVFPESDSDTEDTELQRFTPLRAKMEQFFHVFRPSSIRSRRDSTWSEHHPDLSQTSASSEQALQVVEKPLPAIAISPSPTRAKAFPSRRIPHARSADSLPRRSSEERSLARIRSHEHPALLASPPSHGRGVPLRHANTISTDVPAGDPSSPTIVSSPEQSSSPLDMTASPPLLPTAAPMFRWFRPFFSRDGAQQGVTAPDTLTPPVPAPAPPPPRRGDVVCLKYDTLDDRGMRKLEGRSDHRPVIGSYAVYI